ncbi:hypothetical protein D6764_03100 [Candidatus Woesearchaeota archaeon]|nr:MAG: hypothetical protein D6764_03100 [Candidatus Woesearchaeota archaeon]
MDFVAEKNHEKGQEAVRVFSVKFTLGPPGSRIQTEIHSVNVSPQEAIGLLEMAKDQILSGIREGTQNIMNVQKRG